MNPIFLPYLACPESGEALELLATHVSTDGMVEEGLLRTLSGSQTYPIRQGVPRFVASEMYARSFGFEWNRWPRIQFDSANVGTTMEGYTRRMFERVTMTGDADIKGKTIVEFGCGSGRFLEIIRQKGGRAVGLDLSRAVDAARANFASDPDVLIVQGDILRPPFAKGAFDGAYSIGVLHHTPAPEAGFKALALCVRGGGWIGCVVYEKANTFAVHQFEAYRRIFKRLGPRAQLAYAYVSAGVLEPLSRVPGIGSIVKLLFIIFTIPSFRWRLLDTFDILSPIHQSYHSTREVFEWFANAGLEEIQPTGWGSASFRGRRPVHT